MKAAGSSFVLAGRLNAAERLLALATGVDLTSDHQLQVQQQE